MATASQVSNWLLVEVAGVWGPDAIVHSELGPFAPPVWRRAMRLHGIRVITIRRSLEHRADHERAGVRLVHVVAPRPGSTAGSAHRRVLADLHEVVSATESLAKGGGVGPGWDVDPDRYVLVCTNGRHDACCATFGRPIVRWLRTSEWASDVWECSHIGGDRFAANIVLLPDSLYFGHVDLARTQQILEAHDGRRLDLACFRGRSTLRLAEQAAEHEVRVDLGLDALDAVTNVTSLDDGRVRVDLDDGRAVIARLERTASPAPTPLTCKGQEGHSYPEFRLLELERIPPPAAPQANPDTG